MKFHSTKKLQIANFLFSFIPLTRAYRLKARMLHWAGIQCAKTVRIVSSARILCLNISIGDDVFIGHQVLITGSEDAKIRIGSNVDIAPRVVILSGTHEIDMLSMHSAGRGYGKEVIIEDGAWIGANSTILPGVKIGYKAVIGAGSLVCKDIPAYSVSFGNPVKITKKWDPEKRILRPF